MIPSVRHQFSFNPRPYESKTRVLRFDKEPLDAFPCAFHDLDESVPEAFIKLFFPRWYGGSWAIRPVVFESSCAAPIT